MGNYSTIPIATVGEASLGPGGRGLEVGGRRGGRATVVAGGGDESEREDGDEGGDGALRGLLVHL